MKAAIERFGPAVIVVAALLVTVPRLASAFAMVEPGFLGVQTAWVTGPGYGILAMVTAAYSLQVYQERKSLKLARWILVGWGLILVLASLILLPGMVVQLRRSELAGVLPPPLDAAWCAVLAVSPEIIVGIAALAFALKPSKLAGSRPQPASRQLKPARLFTCSHCSYKAKTQAGLNAHQRKHKPGAADIITREEA